VHAVVTLAPVATAPTFDHVGGVVGHRAQQQVVVAEARLVVAAMAHDHALGDGTIYLLPDPAVEVLLVAMLAVARATTDR